MVFSTDFMYMGLVAPRSSADLLEGLFGETTDQPTTNNSVSPILGNRILTHFDDIDSLTQGLQAGSLVVLAGSTGMGKTSLALNLASNTSRLSQISVLYCTYDSSPNELILRVLASLSGLESNRIRGARLDQNEWQKLGKACLEVGPAPLSFLDHPVDSLQEIRRWCSELDSKECCNQRIVILDHLQQMPELTPGQNIGLASLLQQLRQLASELNVCLILLSQTLPNSELRDGHRPLLNDLPDVGAMQAYSNVIAFLHREEFWKAESAGLGIAELIFYKNQDNPVASLPLRFQPQLSCFSTFSSEQLV